MQALFGSVDEGMELVVDLLAGICEVVQEGEHTAAHQDLFRQAHAVTCSLFSVLLRCLQLGGKHTLLAGPRQGVKGSTAYLCRCLHTLRVSKIQQDTCAVVDG